MKIKHYPYKILKMIKKIEISIPGCIGNVGSGFDCIGISINLFNNFVFEKSREFSISVSDPGIGKDDKNLCLKVFKKTCKSFGKNVPFVHISIKNNIPVARGLGSSGTAVLAGVIAGFIFSDIEIEPERILKIGKDFEGHLDDLAPSLLGGLVIVAETEKKLVWEKIQIPEETKGVFFISEKLYRTEKAREILPEKVSLKDAVYNISRACLIPIGFMEKNKELLQIATDDRLHQIYRKKIYPHFEPLYEAAISADAAGCCLSGAGPSVVAFCFDNPEKIVNSWERLIKAEKIKGYIKVINLGGKTRWKIYDK